VRTTNISQWLLGALWDHSKLPTTDNDIFGIGNTKVPLLRHTKELIILSQSYRPNGLLRQSDGFPKMMDEFVPEEQEALINDGIGQTAMIDGASDVLASISNDQVKVFAQISTYTSR
jgi:hypothetical protein